MRRYICVIMALVMLFAFNSAFAKTDETEVIKTKNLSKELNKKLDFSIELNELNNIEKLTSQISENEDIFTDKKLSKSNIEFEINNKGDISEIVGELTINNKEYTLKGEGNAETYDVIGENDYLVGKFIGIIYKNNKPIREFGMTVEYAVADKEYISSSISLLPTGKNGDKGSSINLSFGNVNKEMNNKFFEKHIFNKKNEENSLQEEEVGIKTIKSPPMTTDGKPIVGKISSSTTAPLIYIAGYNEVSLRSGAVSNINLRTWTKIANVEKYIAYKYGYPVKTNTTKPIEGSLEIYTKIEKVKIASIWPNQPNQTTLNVLIPYYYNGWTYQSITLVTSYLKISQPSFASYICKYGAAAGLKNTDATTSTPWYSSTKCGLAIEALITPSGTVTKDDISAIGWKGSYKFESVLNKLGVYTYVYDTVSGLKYTNINLLK